MLFSCKKWKWHKTARRTGPLRCTYYGEVVYVINYMLKDYFLFLKILNNSIRGTPMVTCVWDSQPLVKGFLGPLKWKFWKILVNWFHKHGNWVIATALKQATKFAPILVVSKVMSWGSYPNTRLVAKANANNPQSLAFVCCWTGAYTKYLKLSANKLWAWSSTSCEIMLWKRLSKSLTIPGEHPIVLIQTRSCMNPRILLVYN